MKKIESHFSILDTIVSELRLAGIQTAELLTAVLLASMPSSFSQAVTTIYMSNETFALSSLALFFPSGVDRRGVMALKQPF